MKDVELYAKVRHAVRIEGVSKRAGCRALRLRSTRLPSRPSFRRWIAVLRGQAARPRASRIISAFRLASAAWR